MLKMLIKLNGTRIVIQILVVSELFIEMHIDLKQVAKMPNVPNIYN